LQVYLNTLTPPVSFARAAQLLNGPEPAFVAVNDLAKLEAVRGSGSGSWDILLPHGPSASDSPTCVVGNRTKLTQTNSIAFCFGGLYIRAYGAKLLAATQREFVFVAQGKSGKVIITNEAAEPRRMLVCIAKGSRRNCQQRVLAGLETWEMEN